MYFRLLLLLVLFGAPTAQAADSSDQPLTKVEAVVTKAEVLETLNDSKAWGVQNDPLRIVYSEEAVVEAILKERRKNKAVRKDGVLTYSGALKSIKSNPNLQNDADIQARLVTLYQNHPFTYIRTSALAALPLTHPDHAVFNTKDYYFSNVDRINYGAIRKDINKSIGYCKYGKPLKPCSSCDSDAEVEKLTPIQGGEKMKNIRITARNVRGGKLVGYSNSVKRFAAGYMSDYGQQSDLGLHYIPEDANLPTKFIYPTNIRYLSERTETGSFWGVTSSPGKCGRSSILKISEKDNGQFHVEPYQNLPGAVEGVGEGESGELYIYFGGEKDIARQCAPITMPIGSGKYNNNPPVIFTAKGEIYSACESEAMKF